MIQVICRPLCKVANLIYENKDLENSPLENEYIFEETLKLLIVMSLNVDFLFFF